ncbi:hypothetical protein [Bdellovibrio sp. GT3]|uniref:hypothetical protein n=1 Tax=Bdellovibrio sp. GT3 TaxID=3136282 RepID=UPI0030F01F43
MKKFILFSIVAGFTTLTLISCGSPPAKEQSQASTTPNDGTFSDETALYFKVSSKWMASDKITTHGSCSISSLTPSTGVPFECEIKIPEGQMYHSDIDFTVGTKLNQLCPMIAFRPYVYRISNRDDDYVPNLSETGDFATCATTPNAIECFGGAMTQVLGASYPEFTFKFFMSALGESSAFTVPAENGLRYYSSTPKKKNYMVSNNMLTAARGTNIAGTYVAGSMLDYQAICYDLWYHPVYTINLRLSDEDSDGSDGGILDEIQDWQ